MKEKYFIECASNHRVPVQLFHAGSSVTCPVCNTDVRVPDTNTLKERNGDKYPLLRNIDKIRKTAELRESPFDGVCHDCGKVRADVEVPIVLQTLVERQIADDGGIRLTVTGVKLVSGAAIESWESTKFPLQLCDQCLSKFQSAQSRSRMMSKLKTFLMISLLFGFVFTAYFNLELIAALAGLLWVIGLVATMVRWRGENKIEGFIRPWLEMIRWVPEAIKDAAEFRIATGKPHPYVADQR